MTQYHLAGINTRPLIEATRGQDVLISYAQLLNAKTQELAESTWGPIREALGAGHFRSAILDSGAFTELSYRKRGVAFKVRLEDYVAFAKEFQHLFCWVTNLDDIEGDVERSNANLEALEAAGVPAVPVYHEGEPLAQLWHCIERARAGLGIIALGCQRPKGSLVPTRVVDFLDWVMPFLAEHAPDLRVHGFGLTRYASPSWCPCKRDGYPFDSVDSTTWIAEACALDRAGATTTRHDAFKVTVDSYGALDWAKPRTYPPTYRHGTDFDREAAELAKGQARTVKRRHERSTNDTTHDSVPGRPDQFVDDRRGPGLAGDGEGRPRPAHRGDRSDGPGLPRAGGRLLQPTRLRGQAGSLEVDPRPVLLLEVVCGHVDGASVRLDERQADDRRGAQRPAAQSVDQGALRASVPRPGRSTSMGQRPRRSARKARAPLDPTARTAIRRRTLSLPARWLLRAGLLDGRPALDYGCGHGKDADILGIEAWDPHLKPKPEPVGPYNVVLCSYVLNVLSEDEAAAALDRIRSLLTPAGVAYVTVRRDMPHDYVNGHGVVQRLVVLDLPVVYETRGFCIYELEKED